MNTTTIFQVEIGNKYVPIFQSLFKQYKLKSQIVEKEDDTKMTKEEFFSMIDKSSKEEKRSITLQEFENKYLK